MTNWIQFIPETHTILWIFACIIILWKLTPFLRAMREASSEPSKDNQRGKVSRKRIIPLIFTFLVGYMVIGNMHSCNSEGFNRIAFYVLMGYIALDTSILQVTQIFGFMDKLSAVKGKAIASEETYKKTTEETTDKRSVATEA